MFSNMQSHLTAQTDRVVNEIRKLRKALTTNVRENVSVNIQNIPPVMFKDINLCDICKGGSTTQVALAVARHLFTDDELATTQMLKKSSKGRPAACAERTTLLLSKWV